MAESLKRPTLDFGLGFHVEVHAGHRDYLRTSLSLCSSPPSFSKTKQKNRKNTSVWSYQQSVTNVTKCGIIKRPWISFQNQWEKGFKHKSVRFWILFMRSHTESKWKNLEFKLIFVFKHSQVLSYKGTAQPKPCSPWRAASRMICRQKIGTTDSSAT